MFVIAVDDGIGMHSVDVIAIDVCEGGDEKGRVSSCTVERKISLVDGRRSKEHLTRPRQELLICTASLQATYALR